MTGADHHDVVVLSPGIAAVNPTLTAMATALRVGDHVLQRPGAAS